MRIAVCGIFSDFIELTMNERMISLQVYPSYLGERLVSSLKATHPYFGLEHVILNVFLTYICN